MRVSFFGACGQPVSNKTLGHIFSLPNSSPGSSIYITIIVAATATSNRRCTLLTICTASQYQSVPSTATSDRNCSTLVPCAPFPREYIAQNATATSDYACGVVRLSCPNGTYTAAAATPTSDLLCPVHSICASWSDQLRGPTATSDRVCRNTVDPGTSSSSSSSSSSSLPIIAGAAGGGVILLIVVIVVLLRRRSANRKNALLPSRPGA